LQPAFFMLPVEFRTKLQVKRQRNPPFEDLNLF
jgi:hypothetical protein